MESPENGLFISLYKNREQRKKLLKIKRLYNIIYYITFEMKYHKYFSLK